ncbi:MAG TPA: CotH kinase family protein [Flavobacteriales bacterium]|nr:CotH kinase family protein [Flavobacteriales bacterium]
MAWPSMVAAQTFSGAGAAIPDDGNTLEIPLVVTGLGAVLDTSSFGLEQVCITVEHMWLSDLDIRIVAPDGTARLLVAGQGGDTDNYTNTCFTNDAEGTIGNGIPPFEGSFRPQGQMGSVNNGQNGNGTWLLRVLDTYPFADEGAVISWSITFGDTPAHYYNFQTSDIPLVVINTNGATIVDADKIMASMGIVDNGPGNLNHLTDAFNAYDGVIGIELRGFSSQNLSPKKSYAVELWDVTGAEVTAPILDMPPESDWVLSANYFDKSLMNNTLTFHLAQGMGHYAPRHRHVEVVLNGEYQGVYVLMEKIKRGGGRVDIAKLDPLEIAGDDLTGGYILSVDRNNGPDNGWVSPYAPVVSGDGQQVYLEYRYPKPENIVPEQAAYIQAFVDSFETALAGDEFTDPGSGYAAFADVPSFIDFFLLNELARNVDGYRLSSFLYKDKNSNGGKLHAGPVWDFDIAWGNADYCRGSDVTGWAHEFGDECGGDGNQVPFWWSRLLEDPNYAEAVRCRWNDLRQGLLSVPAMNAYCDSVAGLLNAAQQHNFSIWPILGQYVWPNPSPIPTTYAGEVQELKDWVLARSEWLDANLPGNINCTVGIEGTSGATIGNIHPNPFTDHVMLGIPGGDTVHVQLLDALGRMVHDAGSFTGNNVPQRLGLPSALTSGTYLLRTTHASGDVEVVRLHH